DSSKALRFKTPRSGSRKLAARIRSFSTARRSWAGRQASSRPTSRASARSGCRPSARKRRRPVVPRPRPTRVRAAGPARGAGEDGSAVEDERRAECPRRLAHRIRSVAAADDPALLDAEGARGALDEDAGAALDVAGEERDLEEVGEAGRQRRRGLVGERRDQR